LSIRIFKKSIIIFATFLPYLAAKYIIPYLLVGARQLRLGLF
jgi:hypothetical protein